MLRVSIALGLMIGAYAQSMEYGPCPKVPTEHMDVDRVTGFWYAHSRSSNHKDDTDLCPALNWTKPVNGRSLFIVSDVSKLININSTLISEVDIVDNSLYLTMHVPGVEIVKKHHYILETDYRNYKVAYRCDQMGDYHESSAWVETRTLQPIKGLDQIVENAFRKRGLRPLAMVKTDQQNCFTR